MAKVDVMDRKIKVYAPIDGEGQFLGLIPGLNILFRAETPMKVVKLADEWRRKEVPKAKRIMGKKP